MLRKLVIDMVICAGSFITGILTPGSDLRKDISLIPEVMRQAAADPRIIDADNRDKEPGRYWHDRKNRLIEYFRFITKTWEEQNSTQIMSGIVKFLSFLIVGQTVLNVLLSLALVLSLAIALS